MTRRFAIAAALAICLLAAVVGVSRSSAVTTAQADSLTYGTVCPGGASGSIDPASTTSYCSRSAIGSDVLDMLEYIGPTGKLRPGLALRVTQPTRLRYVYHLRKGVKFSDGTELTADDVVNALNYARLPRNAGTNGWYAAVKNVSAQDRYTVVVGLKRPDVSLRYTLAIGNSGARIFQKKHQQANASTFGQPGTLLVGSGPYKIDSFDPTTGAELSATPNYWGGTQPAKHVSIKFFQDEQSLALAFRAGQIDVAFPKDAKSFASTAGANVRGAPGCKPNFLYINTLKAPFDDVHVRRALAYAINRADIVRTIGSLAAPSSTVIPPVTLRQIATPRQVNALMNSLPTNKFDLGKARQEMARSKYAGGASTSLYVDPFSSWSPDVAQVLAAQLAKIRLRVDVRKVPQAQWLAAQAEKKDSAKTVPLMSATFGCQDPDPGLNASFFAYTNGGKKNQEYNPSNYRNATADRLLDQASSESNPAKRFSLYARILKIYASDVPVLGLVAAGQNLAISNKFTFPGFSGFTSDDGPWIMRVSAR